jgi:hypothetical protein
MSSVDDGVCATRSITLTKISDFVWEGEVVSWCTDPDTFKVQFRCTQPGDSAGNLEVRVDDGFGTWDSWTTPETESCDPLMADGFPANSINDSSCCSISPGSLTINISE